MLQAFAMYFLSGPLGLLYIGVSENPVIALEPLPILSNMLYWILVTYALMVGLLVSSKKYPSAAGMAIWTVQVGYSEDLISWSPFVEEWLNDVLRSSGIIACGVLGGFLLGQLMQSMGQWKVKDIASIPAIWITIVVVWQWVLLSYNEFGFPLPLLAYPYFLLLLLYPFLFWKVSKL